MGEKLYVERCVWFDNEMRNGRYPNAATLALKFEISHKTAQRTIDYLLPEKATPVSIPSTTCRLSISPKANSRPSWHPGNS